MYSSCILRSSAGNKLAEQVQTLLISHCHLGSNWFKNNDLSLGTNWLPSSLLHYKNCSLWFFSLSLTQTSLGDCCQGMRKKNYLGIKIKHISLCLCHLLWFFWDNLSLHFFSLGVEYPLLVSDHLFTVHMIID